MYGQSFAYLFWTTVVLTVVGLLSGCQPESPPAGPGEGQTGKPQIHGASAETAYSDAQLAVFNRYSNPDSFSVVFAEQDWEAADQPLRLELWNYDQWAVCFRFENGQFAGIAPHSAEDASAKGVAPERPSGWGPGSFQRGMELDQVNQMVGQIPLTGAAFPEDILQVKGEAEFYVYECGLVVGLVDNQLVFVNWSAATGKEPR